jgi:hypothetical protein
MYIKLMMLTDPACEYGPLHGDAGSGVSFSSAAPRKFSLVNLSLGAEGDHEEIGLGEGRSRPDAAFRILQGVQRPHPELDLEIAPELIGDVLETFSCLLPCSKVLIDDYDI